MRIWVTGNAGAGKTTLARRLALDLQLPYIGLDSVVWQPGWKKTPRDSRLEVERRMARGVSWVAEGVSETMSNAADLVIFLDEPRWRCYWRVLRRNIPYLFRSRPGLPEGCPEILIIPSLVRLIWKFSKTQRPGILIRACHGERFLHLQSGVDVLSRSLVHIAALQSRPDIRVSAQNNARDSLLTVSGTPR